MKLVLVSDLHGNLPVIPPCDVLLIAGDICPDMPPSVHILPGQANWLRTSFHAWLNTVPARYKVGVAGNHDWVFGYQDELRKAGAVASALYPQNLPWIYLEHSLIEIAGLKIFGMPWSKLIWGVFQRTEEQLARLYEQIPDGIDVLISHGPPKCAGDYAPSLTDTNAGENCGSESLRKQIQLKRPKLTVFGHIHEGYGQYELDGLSLVNASLVNRDCIPVNNPIGYEL